MTTEELQVLVDFVKLFSNGTKENEQQKALTPGQENEGVK